MTIGIENEIDCKFEFDYKKIIESVITTALDYIKCPFEACISVTITDNAGIQTINKEYRNIDKATDVLSFPMVDYETAGDFSILESDECIDVFDPDTGELVLGDIVLSYDRILSQADEYGHSVIRELAFLVAHSMFHLFGYDHMTEEEAKEMENKQEAVLSILGISR